MCSAGFEPATSSVSIRGIWRLFLYFVIAQHCFFSQRHLDHRVDTDLAPEAPNGLPPGALVAAGSELLSFGGSYVVLEMPGQRVLAVALAERDEHVLVGHAHVHDRIIAAVVDEDAAIVAVHGPAGEHDLWHVNVVCLLDAAVSPGREQDGDARHLDPRRVRQVV